MAVTFQKKSEVEGQLVIKIEEKDFKETYNNKVKEYAKKASFKGFRPGKVPMSVVQKTMGTNVLAEEVFAAVEKEINQYLASNKLTIIGRPLPSETDNGKDIDFATQRNFEFTYDIAIVPDFEVSVSKKLSFMNYKVVADDAKTQEVHESMIKRYGTSEQVEVVAARDLVKGNVKAVGSETEDKINLWLEKLTDANQKEFIGKKVKDVVRFDLQKLFNQEASLIGQFFGISREEASELAGEYDFEIISIARYTDAVVNQEYYDKLFGEGKITSDKEYRAEISKNVTSGYLPNVEYLLFKEMRDELLKTCEINISEAFLKRWILEANQEAKLEEVERDLTKYADEYKWSLIRNKIVQDNKLQASYEEVKQDAFNKVVSQYLGGNAVTEEMKETFNGFIEKYLTEEKGKNYYSHLENILASKVIGFLKENVSLTDKEVTTAEFEEIVEKSL